MAGRFIINENGPPRLNFRPRRRPGHLKAMFAGTISLTKTPVTVALLVVNFALWVGLEATGGSQNTENLLRFGAKFGPYFAMGEWWRAIFPVFLHIGFFHLMANSFGLLIFGSLVERIFGSLTFAAAYLIAGVLGNLFSYWADLEIYNSTIVGAGASGAVFGILGAYGIYLLLNRETLGTMGRQALTSVAVIVVINFIFGLTVSGIDNLAHLGGLLGGGMFAAMVAPVQRIYITGYMPGQVSEYVDVVPKRAWIRPRITGASTAEYAEIKTKRAGPVRIALTIAASCVVLTVLAMLVVNAYLERIGPTG